LSPSRRSFNPVDRFSEFCCSLRSFPGGILTITVQEPPLPEIPHRDWSGSPRN
jgi:hypothetical protein